MAGAFLGLVFLLGASIGSFVNVVVWRLPLKLSLVRPGSTCPACGAPIRGLALLPIFGWLLSRGACRSCRVPVSARYPLVELTVGLVALALWLTRAGPAALPATPQALWLEVMVPFVLELSFAATLIALALIDLDWFLLPNRITLPLCLLGLLAALAIPQQSGVSLASAAQGALLAGGVPLVLGLVHGALTGRVGFGGGDWKLCMAIGAWLGPAAVPFLFVAAPMLALLAILFFRRDLGRAAPPPLPGEPEPEPSPDEASLGRLHVPFGPFLALAALAWLLLRPDIERQLIAAFRGFS